jgi:hypothetical protein
MTRPRRTTVAPLVGAGIVYPLVAEEITPARRLLVP